MSDKTPARTTGQLGGMLRTVALVVVLITVYVLIERWGAVLALGRDIGHTVRG